MHFGLYDRTPLGVEEISKRLDITVNTVKTRQAEGLRFLEDRLRHHR
jgi:DNA-directed RNA polymerase specialized sigma24 family protein